MTTSNTCKSYSIHHWAQIANNNSNHYIGISIPPLHVFMCIQLKTHVAIKTPESLHNTRLRRHPLTLQPAVDSAIHDSEPKLCPHTIF